MTCQVINNITLSVESKKTLKVITEKIKLGSYSKPIMAGGVLFNALVHGKAIPLIFSVTSTDWIALSKAMKSMDAVAKRAVQTEIELMILNTKGKENTFWKNMYECY